MCSTRIPTDVLLANLFSNDHYGRFSLDEVEEYKNFIIDWYSGSINIDLCFENIRSVCDRYPLLFRWEPSSDDNVYIYSGPCKVNLAFFNAAYTEGMQGFLKKTTSYFIDQVISTRR